MVISALEMEYGNLPFVFLVFQSTSGCLKTCANVHVCAMFIWSLLIIKMGNGSHDSILAVSTIDRKLLRERLCSQKIYRMSLLSTRI
jgi:hypothetical protein